MASSIGGPIRRLIMRRPTSHWHREAVGGRWEEIGRLQFDWMRQQGLEPGHLLLDMGCGSLRGGVHFVSYLDPGHYFGLDIDARLLEAGERELARRGLDDRRATLLRSEGFEAERIGVEFDCAPAHSLFTHLPLNSVATSIARGEGAAPRRPVLRDVLREPGGARDTMPVVHTTAEGTLTTYPDRDPFHYGLDAFQWLCEPMSLELDYIGEWGHPRDQWMLAFTRAKGALAG